MRHAKTMLTLKKITFPLVLLALSACGDSGSSVVKPDDSDFAKVRGIHLASEAPEVDFHFTRSGGLPVLLSDLSFGETTGFEDLESGNYTMIVTLPGEPISNSLLTLAPLPAAVDVSYTAVVIGPVDDLTGLWLAEDSEGIPAGNIRIRAIHADSETGEIDLWDIPNAAFPTPLFTNIAYGNATEYLDLPAGMLTLGADLNNDAVSDLFFRIPGLPAGTVANLFVVRDEDDKVNLVIQTESGDPITIPGDGNVTPEAGTLRVMHLVPQGSNFDVLVDEEATDFASALAFGMSSLTKPLNAGLHSLRVVESGGFTETLYEDPKLNIPEGESQTLVLFDELSGVDGLLLFDDFTNLAPTTVRFRAIHVGIGLGEADIWHMPVGGTASVLFENLDFGEASNTLDALQGVYRLGVDTTDDGEAEYTFLLPFLTDQFVNLYVATDQNDAPFLALQFADDFVIRVDPETEPDSELRVLHLAPEAEAIDVHLNAQSEPTVSGLEFLTGTAFQPLEPGTYDLTVSPTGLGPDASLLDLQDLPFNSGIKYTAVAFGAGSEIEGGLIPEPTPSIDPEEIVVRFVHTASEIGPIDVYALFGDGSSDTWTNALGFGEYTMAMEIPGAQYRIGINVDEDPDPDLTFQLPTLVVGTVANLFLASDVQDVFVLIQNENGVLTRVDAESPSQ
ncbi:MAG: DUF4397 domain-containing protein [Candidatus Eisenbacteria bacterium]|uniref:DUF4397 domain-containing protein n=1 Tax=Eiseniibacteriota bacterium TaxID=2212470 RepID=A0A7Y2ED17_UNCEI|nr:DUF4397 domain-containing protein [Candidatus Eisenbacteria bacterium]